MRRRRNELEYPTGPGETTTNDEAQKAIQDAEGCFWRLSSCCYPLHLLTGTEDQLPEGRY